MPAKVLLLIVDGIGDVTIPAFGDRTPLQVAHTPYLDAVAGDPSCGSGVSAQWSGNPPEAHPSLQQQQQQQPV